MNTGRTTTGQIAPATGQITATGPVTLWPSTRCGVNVHVWACDHAKTCVCTLAMRTVPVVTCPVCGA